MVRRSLLFFVLVAFLSVPRAAAIDPQPSAFAPQALCGTSTQSGTFTLRASPTQVAVGESFTLSWCDPTWSVIDAGFSVTRYDIYYSRANASWAAMGAVAGLSANFRAEAKDAGVSHRFFIRAVGTEQSIMGPRPATRDSNVVQVVVEAALPAPVLSADRPWVAFGDNYTISWTGVFSGTTSGTYSVFERKSPSTSWTQIATVPQTTTSLTRTNTIGPAGGTADYYVKAVASGGYASLDKSGEFSISNNITVILSGAPCPTGICAINGRFNISIAAKDPRSGRTGGGTPQQLNDLFGYFSIPGLTANTNNPEVFVKVLDAGNDKFWVFYGTMTDFELKITVRDTKTGRLRDYTREGLNLCGDADTNAFALPDEGIVVAAATPVVAGPTEPTSVGPGNCDSGTGLCLIAGRFQVKLTATDPRTQRSAAGVPNRLNNLFGYFSLPGLTSNPDNPEVFVKVLDAGNDSFWVFHGGMTDFAYTVTVTDLVESREKTYTKEPYKLCGGADTAAFP
jgi:hypothetical protein